MEISSRKLNIDGFEESLFTDNLICVYSESPLIDLRVHITSESIYNSITNLAELTSYIYSRGTSYTGVKGRFEYTDYMGRKKYSNSITNITATSTSITLHGPSSAAKDLNGLSLSFFKGIPDINITSKTMQQIAVDSFNLPYVSTENTVNSASTEPIQIPKTIVYDLIGSSSGFSAVHIPNPILNPSSASSTPVSGGPKFELELMSTGGNGAGFTLKSELTRNSSILERIYIPREGALITYCKLLGWFSSISHDEVKLHLEGIIFVISDGTTSYGKFEGVSVDCSTYKYQASGSGTYWNLFVKPSAGQGASIREVLTYLDYSETF